MNFAQRLEYSMRGRLPLVMKRIREWNLIPYIPGNAPLSALSAIMQEGDYVMGDAVNFAYQRHTAIASGLGSMELEPGKSYRLTFEADRPSHNFTLPGDGFIDLPGYHAKLRVYKIAFRAPNLVDIDIHVCRDVQTRSSSAIGESVIAGPALVVPIAIVIIVAAVAAALLSVFGYLTLREVKRIIVSPSGLLIGVAILVLLFPTIRGALSRRAA